MESMWYRMETVYHVMSYAEEVVSDWSDPALYIELFVNRREHLTQFLEHQIMTHVSLPPSLPPYEMFSLPPPLSL